MPRQAGRVSKHADHRNQRRPCAAAGQLRGQGRRGFLAQRHAGTEAQWVGRFWMKNDDNMWEKARKTWGKRKILWWSYDLYNEDFKKKTRGIQAI